MLRSTSLPRLLFWGGGGGGGSVNTGFGLGRLSIVRTTGHACAEMLNVSTKSICLLRKGNRTFLSRFPLLVDSQISQIIAVQIPSRRVLALQSAARGERGEGWKKKLKSGHYDP